MVAYNFCLFLGGRLFTRCVIFLGRHKQTPPHRRQAINYRQEAQRSHIWLGEFTGSLTESQRLERSGITQKPTPVQVMIQESCISAAPCSAAGCPSEPPAGVCSFQAPGREGLWILEVISAFTLLRSPGFWGFWVSPSSLAPGDGASAWRKHRLCSNVSFAV